MIELHQDTKEELANVLTDLLTQLQTMHSADDAADALESALGEFCRDHLDCDVDETGSVIVKVAQAETIN